MLSNIENLVFNFDTIHKNKNTSSTTKNSFNANGSAVNAIASALVSEYKTKEENETSNSSGSKNIFAIANMSTSEYLNYAYSNEARAEFNAKNQDSTGIDLPMIVRYKGEVVSTAGKSFMQVVAKFKAKYPRRSEEEIAAELMSKYATKEQVAALTQKYGIMTTLGGTVKTPSTTGNSINMSA